MKSKKSTVTVVSTMHYEHGPKDSVMQLASNDLSFEIVGSVDQTMYFDGKGLPRKLTSRVVTDALVMGLINNIRNSHDKGWEDSQQHLDFIKMRLEAAVVAPKADEHKLKSV